MNAHLEVKLCGQTRPDEAAACVDLGADAVGVIFHRPSPRFIEPDKARDIVRALPPGFPVVAVFAGSPLDEILRLVEEAGIGLIQLHGNEDDSMVHALMRHGHGVIRVLKTTGSNLLCEAAAVPSDCGILVEAGKGPLPGGNAAAWNWAEAQPLSWLRPFALAGGLTPENAARAAEAAHPSALDLSSGIENEPGRKNLDKTRRLMENIRQISITWPVAPVFRANRSKGNQPCPDNR